MWVGGWVRGWSGCFLEVGFGLGMHGKGPRRDGFGGVIGCGWRCKGRLGASKHTGYASRERLGY